MQSLTVTRHAQCAKPPEKISIFSRILYKENFLEMSEGRSLLLGHAAPGSPHGRGAYIPYSLELTPPSIISPPLLFAKICCGGIFISNLSPP